jgi:C1A family cysteine protease
MKIKTNSLKTVVFLMITVLFGLTISPFIAGIDNQTHQPETALLSVTKDPQTNQTHIKYMSNPAAIYCRELGYDYQLMEGKEGQSGQCVLPDTVCDGWDFLNGKCGQEYNVCAQQGLKTVVRADGKNVYSQEYALCVSEDGKTSTSATTIFGMDDKMTNSRCAQDDLERNAQIPTPSETNLIESLLSQPNKLFTFEPPFSIYFPFIMRGSQVDTNSFDWRNYNGSNWLTPVRDQGSCGGCWAFSAIGVVEASLNIASDNPNLDKDLSEQYLISDCDDSIGSCCGGTMAGALGFIQEEGVPDENCMPYIDGNSCNCDETCMCTYNSGDEYICSNTTCSDRCDDWSSRLSLINEYGYVPNNREIIKDKLREYGPLAAAMNFEEDNQFDENGIYRCKTNDDLNHGVIIVGYNNSDGYWIIRNSWGSTWNGDGYFKLGYGECGIEQDVSYGVIH